MRKKPGYCIHRPTGQAYVNLAGKVHYLGQHGTSESREAYNRLKAEWLVNRRAAKIAAQQSISGPTMADVCLAYLDHDESYCETGNEPHNLRLALKPISELYAKRPVANQSPLEYETIRNWWLRKPTGKNQKPGDIADPTCTRQYVISQMKLLIGL